jgi:pectate lyase C
MLRTLFISAVWLLLCNPSAYADRPAGYVTLCTSAEASCTLATTTNVAFNRNNRYSFRVLTGDFSCEPATFGSEPATGDEVYECSVPSGPAAAHTRPQLVPGASSI